MGKRAPAASPHSSQAKQAKSAIKADVKRMLDTASDEPNHINALYNGRIAESITAVLSHPKFESMSSEAPLGIGDGGFKAVYSDDDRKQAMNTNGMYEASCNLAWCNMFWSPDINVPRHVNRVRRLGDALFPDGRPPVLSYPLVVALESKGTEPMTLRGSIRIVSPIEIVHSLWLKTEAAIHSGAGDAVLDGFLKCFRSATLRFQVFPNMKSLHFESVNIRDQFVSTAAEIERTVCQRIHEVLDFKAQL